MIRLTYRDDVKIHEVVDAGGDNRHARMDVLEDDFKAAADLDRYRRPSASLDRALLK